MLVNTWRNDFLHHPITLYVSVNLRRHSSEEDPERVKAEIQAALARLGAIIVQKRSKADVLVVDRKALFFTEKIVGEVRRAKRTWQRFGERAWAEACVRDGRMMPLENLEGEVLEDEVAVAGPSGRREGQEDEGGKGTTPSGTARRAGAPGPSSPRVDVHRSPAIASPVRQPRQSSHSHSPRTTTTFVAAGAAAEPIAQHVSTAVQTSETIVSSSGGAGGAAGQVVASTATVQVEVADAATQVPEGTAPTDSKARDGEAVADSSRAVDQDTNAVEDVPAISTSAAAAASGVTVQRTTASAPEGSPSGSTSAQPIRVTGRPRWATAQRPIKTTRRDSFESADGSPAPGLPSREERQQRRAEADVEERRRQREDSFLEDDDADAVFFKKGPGRPTGKCVELTCDELV